MIPQATGILRLDWLINLNAQNAILNNSPLPKLPRALDKFVAEADRIGVHRQDLSELIYAVQRAQENLNCYWQAIGLSPEKVLARNPENNGDAEFFADKLLHISNEGADYAVTVPQQNKNLTTESPSCMPSSTGDSLNAGVATDPQSTAAFPPDFTGMRGH